MGPERLFEETEGLDAYRRVRFDNMTMGSIRLQSIHRTEYMSTDAENLGIMVVVGWGGEVPFCSNFLVICGDLCRFWTLQTIDLEPLQKNHERCYRLENITEGNLEQRKDAVKIL